MQIGFDIGANTPTAILSLHALVAVLFTGIGVSNFTAGRPLGLALNGFIGVLILAAGVAAARIAANR